MPKVNGTYKMSAWNETTLRDLAPPQKCTSVAAPGTFSGPLIGEAETFYVLSYVSADTGVFSGFTLFEGSIGDLEGGFVLEDDGTFDTKAATSKWTIVKDSGTGDLKGISGTGGFSATDGLTISFELEYSLPA